MRSFLVRLHEPIDKALIESEAIAKKASEFDKIPGLRLWTDDFNNLFQILK